MDIWIFLAFIDFVFHSDIKRILTGHSGLNVWLCVMLLIGKMKHGSLEKHNSHPFPLLSRSCRTECAVWHSCTSQTLLLSALWWTRRLPSGRPVSPKQTAVNHSDSTNYIKEQTVIAFSLNRDVFKTNRQVKTNTVVLN